MDFDTSVFLNCPFDDDYLPLLRPILFFILDLGLQPRIALERLDSGRPRLEKIIALIGESKYAIHDLSRLQAKEAGEYYRLNMPFELGLDVGCRLFREGRWVDKKCLNPRGSEIPISGCNLGHVQLRYRRPRQRPGRGLGTGTKLAQHRGWPPRSRAESALGALH
jgi:hypothetical protein